MTMIEPETQDNGGYIEFVNKSHSGKGDKIRIVASVENDNSQATFAIRNEDHTLGNALRYVIMKNPAVVLCAYVIPHPSEPFLNLRIQTDSSISAVDALHQGLDDLESFAETLSLKMNQSFQEFQNQ